MNTICADAVERVLGRKLYKGELAGLDARLARHMRQNAIHNSKAGISLTPLEQLKQAAETAGKELHHEYQKKQQRVYLQILKKNKIEKFLTQHKGGKMDALARLARIVAFHADSAVNFMSMETLAKAIRADALRQMIGTMEATNTKFFGLFSNEEDVRAVVHELYNEDSGNAAAKEGAKQFKEVVEALRQRFNAAGGDIRNKDDWALPQHHSQRKVAKAGREQWIADTLPKLDRSKYMNIDGARMTDEQVAEFLSHAWETLATGGANKIEPGKPHGIGMRANRHSESRQIHFKDADSYIEYQSKYGELTLYDVLVGHIDTIAKDIAMIETLGPNPNHAFQYFLDLAVKSELDGENIHLDKVNKKAVQVENLYNELSGNTPRVASVGLARAFDSMRSLLVAARLGSAVISSFPDEGIMRLTARVNNLPQVRLFINELAALNPADQTEKRLALRAGLGLNTYIDTLRRFGHEVLGASFSSKMATGVLRASGFFALNNARRRAFGVTMMSALGQITRDFDSLAKLDPVDHKVLLAKGITETDYKVWQLAQLEDWGGGNDTMLTPESIYRIPDHELAKIGDPRTLRQQAATKLLGVVLEETDMAVVEPGVREREIMYGNVQRGTWKGELMRSFFLFKSFPIAMLSRHWMRGMSMDTAGGKAVYIAELVAATTLLGAVSLIVNDVLMGRDPRNFNPAEKGGVQHLIQAMLKGGSLGIYGDFLLSESTQGYQTPIATLAGPVAGLFESMFNLTQGNIVQMLQGDETNFGAEAVRFVKGITPGGNLWYAKAALDHMIFHQMQEYFSPGYLAKMRRRAYRDFGQTFWWGPGEEMPERHPNLTKAFGIGE